MKLHINLFLAGVILWIALLFQLTESLAADALNDSDDPAAELASFQVAEGFEVKLFASEKDGVQKPIQMRFDARGRLWVIGSTVYPQIEPGQVPNDKVIILEDTDHDGVCDKSTIFADGLMIPTGLEVGDGGAYVGHGTELLFLKDTDGDGKADERRVLFRGFGTADNHQNINSFLWGPGGELWMSQGLHTHSKVETPWGLVVLEKAGLWRFWPRRMKLEGAYGSEYEPQNPWGCVFTDWGEPIILAGNNSSPIYPVPGLVPLRRDEPPPLIWKNGNGRKTSGGDIVGTAHFPEAWQNLLILGGYINNAVWALKIQDDGAGFTLEDAPPLIRSSSRKFRPVDVKFGPEGALYICDWYNPIIGHYQASFRHPDRDKIHGRIWRVTAKGRPLTNIPSFAAKSADQLLEFLNSPDRWTRRFAKRALADMPTPQVTNALSTWLRTAKRSEHEMMEALGIYQSHEVIAPELLKQLARAANVGARAYAAGVTGVWADRLASPLDLLEPLVRDENPRVRCQAVVACARVAEPGALRVVLKAGEHPLDKFLSYAVNQAVFALKPVWKPAMARLHLDKDSLSLLIRADGSADTLEYVRNSLSDTSIPSVRQDLCLTLIEFGNAADLARVLQLRNGIDEQKILPEAVAAVRARNLRPATNLEPILQPLLESANPVICGNALKLAALWKLSSVSDQTFKTAKDQRASPALRRLAVEALSLSGGYTEVLLELVRGPDQTVRAAAIAAITSADLTTGSRLAADALAEPGPESFYSEILTAVLQRQKGADSLSEALRGRALDKAAATTGLKLMASSGRANRNLMELFNTALGTGGTQHLKLSDTDKLMLEVSAHGDSKRGASVFRRPDLGCSSCHAVNGEGGTVGPNLSSLGTAQPIDFIIGAILDPQKEIKEGFMSVSILMKDGEEFQGYVRRESKEGLVVHDVLQNKDVNLRRDQIKDQKPGGSVMPSGLCDNLTRGQFCDLVKFLSELGRQ